VLAIGALVTVSLIIGGGLLLRAEADTNKIALSSEPKGVTVVEARASSFRPSHRYVGTVQPWLRARVGPQLASGYVDSVTVRPGDVVKKGTVLATLDCRNASTASLAIVQQAKALEQRQKASAKEASRLGELLDGGFAAENEVDQKRAIAAANDAQLQAVLAQASGKSLEVGDCILRAPFDGEIALRLADPGSFVRPGGSIVDLVDRRVVRIEADVPETDNAAIAVGSEVRVRLFASGRTLSAKVARRAPGADPGTRTIHFELDVPNEDRSLPVGTTAEIVVNEGELRDATEVPILAGKVRSGNATFFVVEDGVATKRVVEVLGERGGSLFVARTLVPGSRVVTQGRSLLANGDRVTERVEAPAASGPPAAPLVPASKGSAP
jgi:RND family efflux transporter MFP subunit